MTLELMSEDDKEVSHIHISKASRSQGDSVANVKVWSQKQIAHVPEICLEHSEWVMVRGRNK